MKYARVVDGLVVEVTDELEGELETLFHPDLAVQMQPAPLGCAPRWRLQGSVLVPGAPDLERLRAGKRQAIEGAAGARIALGLHYGGKVIQIDDSSRQNIAAVATRALGVVQGVPGMGWPDGFAWRCLDNSWLPIGAAELLAMGQQAADLYTAIVVRRSVLKDAVEAAADAAAIEAIDPAGGWPA